MTGVRNHEERPDDLFQSSSSVVGYPSSHQRRSPHRVAAGACVNVSAIRQRCITVITVVYLGACVVLFRCVARSHAPFPSLVDLAVNVADRSLSRGSRTARFASAFHFQKVLPSCNSHFISLVTESPHSSSIVPVPELSASCRFPSVPKVTRYVWSGLSYWCAISACRRITLGGSHMRHIDAAYYNDSTCRKQRNLQRTCIECRPHVCG
jgi:hypothetical protein